MDTALKNVDNDPATPWLTRLVTAYRRGNLAQAEALARFTLDQGIEDPLLYCLLGHVARAVGAEENARRWYHAALDLDPSFREAHHSLAQPPQHTPRRHDRGYVLIKAWGQGFWSDIEHVLGALLLARMTQRTPIVRWGTNSLFGRGSPDDNVFERYFEPVSPTLFDACVTAGAQGGFFPPKWSTSNITSEDVHKWSGSYARLPAIALLHRPEAVIVSDYYTGCTDLVPWITPEHEYYGWSIAAVQRDLVKRYLRLRPEMTKRVDEFVSMYLSEYTTLAVHVRGTDKINEVTHLNRIQSHFPDYIESFIAAYPLSRLFLLCDSTKTIQDYTARYGDRLTYTDCLRSSGNKGVHLMGHDGVQIGTDIVVDSYIATRCDYFLGSGYSNVANAIGYLRDWPPGRYALFDGNVRWQRNLCLHDW